MEGRVKMSEYYLTEEERKIEKDINNLQPINKEKRKKIEKIIDRAKKNRVISLRMNNYDLEKIKERAKEEGIPYQTLISMVLHKYVAKQLVDKEEILKIVNTLKEKEII